MTRTVQGSPAKGFFIDMITRDIDLADCILDLVDNAVDAAGSQSPSGRERREGALAGFRIDISLSADEFVIEDNCGGMSIEVAQDYAFHFGRPPQAPEGVPEPEASIGIYGIGMKRAMFKLGRLINVRSSTTEESFTVQIDVHRWQFEKDPDDWTFDLEPGEPLDVSGLRIAVTRLKPEVSANLGESGFATQLRKTLGRDYALFIQRGLQITVNDVHVRPIDFTLLEGGGFRPARVEFSTEDGVTVDIIAGMAAPPPEDDSAQAEEPEPDRYGWFVLCNDRTVLAGDKTDRTVWGDNGFRRWHFQYYGFLGIASFHSEHPELLPWTTTKRDVDETAPVYRRAVAKMKELTAAYIAYTNARKGNLQEAKAKEAEASAKSIAEVSRTTSMAVPAIMPLPKIEVANIQYQKPIETVNKAMSALSRSRLSFKEVGERTFDYFYEREVED